MKSKLKFSIVIISALILLVDGFSYSMNPDGPDGWGTKCKGQRQSPVDIDFNKVENGNFSTLLKVQRFRDPASSVIVKNTGHSFSVKFTYADGKPAQLMGGPLLNETYNIVDTHFHWGKNDLRGSEHSFNGQRFAAEGHVVSYNSKYSSIEDATSHPDGLAVLAVLFQWSDEYDNLIFNLTSKVVKPGTEFTAENVLTMFDLIGDKKMKMDVGEFHVLTYDGSLTTPGCNEVVTWLVSIHPIGISSKDLKLLRSLHDDKGHVMNVNWRPVQKMNSRVVVFQ